MPEDRWPVRVGVNVMRARLTIIGFNIAIVSFQIAILNRVPGGVRVAGLEHRGTRRGRYSSLHCLGPVPGCDDCIYHVQCIRRGWLLHPLDAGGR